MPAFPLEMAASKRFVEGKLPFFDPRRSYTTALRCNGPCPVGYWTLDHVQQGSGDLRVINAGPAAAGVQSKQASWTCHDCRFANHAVAFQQRCGCPMNMGYFISADGFDQSTRRTGMSATVLAMRLANGGNWASAEETVVPLLVLGTAEWDALVRQGSPQISGYDIINGLIVELAREMAEDGFMARVAAPQSMWDPGSTVEAFVPRRLFAFLLGISADYPAMADLLDTKQGGQVPLPTSWYSGTRVINKYEYPIPPGTGRYDSLDVPRPRTLTSVINAGRAADKGGATWSAFVPQYWDRLPSLRHAGDRLLLQEAERTGHAVPAQDQEARAKQILCDRGSLATAAAAALRHRLVGLKKLPTAVRLYAICGMDFTQDSAPDVMHTVIEKQGKDVLVLAVHKFMLPADVLYQQATRLFSTEMRVDAPSKLSAVTNFTADEVKHAVLYLGDAIVDQLLYMKQQGAYRQPEYTGTDAQLNAFLCLLRVTTAIFNLIWNDAERPGGPGWTASNIHQLHELQVAYKSYKEVVDGGAGQAPLEITAVLSVVRGIRLWGSTRPHAQYWQERLIKKANSKTTNNIAGERELTRTQKLGREIGIYHVRRLLDDALDSVTMTNGSFVLQLESTLAGADQGGGCFAFDSIDAARLAYEAAERSAPLPAANLARQLLGGYAVVLSNAARYDISKKRSAAYALLEVDGPQDQVPGPDGNVPISDEDLVRQHFLRQGDIPASAHIWEAKAIVRRGGFTIRRQRQGEDGAAAIRLRGSNRKAGHQLLGNHEIKSPGDVFAVQNQDNPHGDPWCCSVPEILTFRQDGRPRRVAVLLDVHGPVDLASMPRDRFGAYDERQVTIEPHIPLGKT